MYKQAADLFANDLFDELTESGILDDPDIYCGYTDQPISMTETPADLRDYSFDKDYNRNYMIKNTFRFARCTLNQDGVDGRTENSLYIELIPCNYPIENYTGQRKLDFVYNDIDFWKM